MSAAASDPVVLYRPVGPAELALVRESGWRSFPPRLPDQPIFYPVLNESYATAIAKDWNAPDPNIGAGFVLRFSVDAAFLRQYEVHRVGGREHEEYWIPAEELDNFNAHIVGLIEQISEFHGDAKA